VHVRSRSLGPPGDGHHEGHAHSWRRAMSRGGFLKAAAGAGGAALSSQLWLPSLAEAAKPMPALPKPIPQTLPGTPFHVQLGPNVESSSITDFNGVLGVAHIQGTATGTDTTTGVVTPGLLYDADMRFMTGEYVGVDGRHYQGAFGFL